MFRNKLYDIGIPIITFILGIFAQVLFDQWITSKNVIFLGLAIIMLCLVVIFIIFRVADKRFDALEKEVLDIAASTGLRVEFVEDGPDGISYKRGKELIESAKYSLTIVSPWEPFAEYLDELPDTDLKNARTEYYEAVKKQIIRNQSSDTLFHRRIIQISKEHEEIPFFTFKTDPTFYKYLKFSAETQEAYPHSCQLRWAIRYVDSHFTIIDDRYVIMPIFSRIGNERLKRYGTFIFTDSQGDLVKCLDRIYRSLDTRSHPITSKLLIAPPIRT